MEQPMEKAIPYKHRVRLLVRTRRRTPCFYQGTGKCSRRCSRMFSNNVRGCSRMFPNNVRGCSRTYQNLEKNIETSFLETVFSRAKCRLSGHKKNFVSNKFWNRNCTSLVYFVERIVLQSISIEFFHKKSTFFKGCRDLPVWIGESSSTRKLVTLEGWVILSVKWHWKMDISANFCRTAVDFLKK